MIKRSSTTLALTFFGLIVILTGCGTTAKDAWTNVVKKCTETEITTKDIVYMGPSNNVGVGALWRKRSGGYVLSRRTDEIIIPTKVINVGEWSTCEGNSKKRFKLKANADMVLSQIAGTVGLGKNLNRAKSVKVSVGKWRILQLVEDEFMDWIEKDLSPENPYKVSLGRKGRLVAYRAVQTQGLTASYTFDSDIALDVKANFNNPVPNAEVGELGVTLEPQWINNTTLEVTSRNDFYIVAELAGYYPGTGIGKGGLSPISIEPDASLSYEPDK